MLIDRLKGYYRDVRGWMQAADAHERTLESLGALLTSYVQNKDKISSLHEVEFRIYSQWGDDGIIQWLISKIPQLPKRFVEFGVENYIESNTRFLMVSNNWSGLVMDGSIEKIKWLKKRKWYWRYDLTAKHSFLTCGNVDQIIDEWASGEAVGLLHIDVDGNDYWLWDAIQCIEPSIVIVEYNALFGPKRAISVPYKSDFRRHGAHHSGQYAGASLSALTHLAEKKGYALVGTNSAGNNAYFVHASKLSDTVRRVTVGEAFIASKFRDSRNQRGQLTYLSYKERQNLICGLPVFNVISNKIEPF